MNATPGIPAPVAWVLYDGACGFCSRFVSSFGNTLARHGFGVAALQDPRVSERLDAAGVPADAQLDDFRILVDGTGQVVTGANAYRWLFRRIWWAKPLWLLSVTPGLRTLFDAGYRTFAENRYRVSKACRIEGR